jgi:HSP20 family protein
MSLIPYSNFFDDDFMDRFLATSRTSKSGFFAPKVDISETDNQFVVTAEVPGVKKEDVHIHLENGMLTIEAETRDEKKEEKNGKVIRQERSYGKYSRSFGVGDNIQEKDINASYTDGVLTLTFPKAEATSPSRKKIEIS